MVKIGRRDANALAATARASLGRNPAFTRTHVHRLRETAGRSEINVSTTLWTASLSRRAVVFTLHFEPSLLHGAASDERLVLDLLAPHDAVQTRRHKAAIAHGLDTVEATALDPDAVLIDRATAQMLAGRGVDLVEEVAWHRRNAFDAGDQDAVECTSLSTHGTLPVTTITLDQPGIRPVMRLRLPIGPAGRPSAYLHGATLSVNATLPGTILVAAAGRRLGEILTSGVPALDARRVSSAEANGSRSIFELEVDNITIGEARTACRP